MEEGVGGGCGSIESGKVTTSFQSVNGRQRFTVELRPGETTIVSWKKLLKDAAKVSGPPVVPEPPSNAHPALESRIAPGQALPDEVGNASPGNRLSAVIEKIESLYKGKHSSDEEDLNEIRDDDEYDTDDSFIDDTELDEYFEVDNSAIKHDGFFVNRGKLERIETSSLPNQHPKKRLRKDLSKGQGESDDGHTQNKNAKVGKKTAVSSALLIGKNSGIPSDSIAFPGAHYEDANVMSASELYSNTKFTDAKAAKNPYSLGIPNGEIVLGVKAIEKQKVEVPPLKNHVNKLKDGSHFSDASNQVLNDQNLCVQHKSQRAKTVDNVNNIVVQQKEKTGLREQPDSNISEGKSSMKSPKVPQTQRKDVSSVRSKSSMLEKAIRELEKIVAESRPSTTDVQVADAQAVKRRLRPEIKQKLAKVARLAQASNGKISKELINRLMTIVGHLMQLRTLKRNLNVMINNGLLAKKEKDDRFQQIKKEVIEMLKVRVPLLKSKEVDQQAGVSDNFHEVGQEQKEPKRKFSVVDVLEDKICDLYDLYIDGLEEDGGLQVKKLYAELAELWPSGFMDNHGIKRAICRAKERRRALYNRRKDQEKIKRKMLTNKTEGILVDASSSIAQPQYIQQKQVDDSSINGSTSHLKQVNDMTIANLAARIPIPFSSGPSIDRQKHDKGSTSNVGDTRADALPKKKVKRKPESELSEANIRSDKLNSAQGEERPKSQKQVTALLQPTNFQSAGPPNFQ